MTFAFIGSYLIQPWTWATEMRWNELPSLWYIIWLVAWHFWADVGSFGPKAKPLTKAFVCGEFPDCILGAMYVGSCWVHVEPFGHMIESFT